MAYNIAQYIGNYNDNTTYIDSVQATGPTDIQYTVFDTNVTQKTFQITSSIVSDNVYYLKFTITNNNNSALEISVNLRQSQNTKQLYFPETLIVPAKSGNNAGTLTKEIIFSPKNTYTQIDFVINRNFGNQTLKITPSIELYKIRNLISSSVANGHGVVKKIGVRSNPGFSMVVNREWIRIGASRIYQLNNNIDITFLGFFPKEGQSFVVDYEY